MRVLMIISVSLILLLNNCNAGNPEKTKSSTKSTAPSSVKVMTNEMFKTQVFNYEKNKQWKYEGKLPAIIDFYADWCGPCRVLSPRVEEIAKQYEGKIVVYKVDTDTERVLAQSMGIQSLPTLLFIPLQGQPTATMGAVPKETLLKAIKEVLLVK